MFETKILILFSPFLLVAKAQYDMSGGWFYPGEMQLSPCQQPNGYFPICSDYLTNCDCYVECENNGCGNQPVQQSTTTVTPATTQSLSIFSELEFIQDIFKFAVSNILRTLSQIAKSPFTDSSTALIQDIVKSAVSNILSNSDISELSKTTKSPSTDSNIALIKDILKSAISNVSPSSDTSTSSETTEPPTQSPSNKDNLDIVKDRLNSVFSNILGESPL